VAIYVRTRDGGPETEVKNPFTVSGPES
jgi:hypothetical protein